MIYSRGVIPDRYNSVTRKTLTLCGSYYLESFTESLDSLRSTRAGSSPPVPPDGRFETGPR